MYRDEVRGATGAHDTPAELTLAFVGELVAEQLSVEAIHRLYTGRSRSSGCARSGGVRSTWRRPDRADAGDAGRDGGSADRWCSSDRDGAGRG